MTELLLACIGATLVMWLLYIVGIQYKRGGWWLIVAPFTIAAFLIDVLLNYTLFALLTWDYPLDGERTFSNRLKRLVRNSDWRGGLALWIAHHMLDPFDPSGKHI